MHDTPSARILSQAASSAFVDALLTRLAIAFDDHDVDMESPAKHTPATIESVIQKISETRNQFFVGFRDLRIGFNLIMLIQRFFESQGHKGLSGWSSETTKGPNQSGGMRFKAMLNVLKGNVEKEIKDLGLLTR